LRLPFSRKAAPRPDADGRKRFLLATGAALAGAVVSRQLLRNALRFSAGEEAGIPPGGRSIEEFYERCVACGACVSVCPTKVITTLGLHPFAGVGKPRMDYGNASCSYECNACLAVCPSGALSYFPLPVKRRIKIGSSALDKKLCIPYAKERDCAACHEQCPTGAIAMVPHKRVRAPELTDHYCIGCGACQDACPTRPVKAITVKPRKLHTFAFIPRKAQQNVRLADIPKDEETGFPF